MRAPCAPTHRRRVILSATILTMLLATAPDAHAIPVSIAGPACPTSGPISDNVQLTGNITQNLNSNGICIQVASGKDVNLGAYSITCNTNCGTAIVATGNGTDITGVSGSAAIIGAWGIGVKGATTIENTIISGPAVAIKDDGDRMKTALNNQFACVGTAACVDVTLPRSTDELSSNDISSTAGTALKMGGSPSGSGPLVQLNDMSASAPDVVVQQVGSTKKLRMIENLVSGTGTPFSIEASSQVTVNQWRGNQCSDAFYCPPDVACSNGGDPVCGPDGLVYCTGQ